MAKSKKIETKPKNKHSPKKDLFQLEDADIHLTPRQKRFCMEYINCGFNATQAAKNAKYDKNSANEQGCRLLANVNIQKYIKLLQDDLGERLGITAEKIALEMAKIGFSNIKNLLTVDGGVKPFHDVEDDITACIESIEINDNVVDDMVIGQTKKIKLWNKQKALCDLTVMLGYNKPTKVADTNPDGSAKEDPLLKLIQSGGKIVIGGK